MSAGAWIVVCAVALAVAFGLYRAITDGRFRGAPAPVVEPQGGPVVESRSALAGPVVEPRGAPGAERVETTLADSQTSLLAGTPWAADLGERATLVQFSSAFCAPCRATRQTLADVSARTDGVVHVEIDAESHLDLVRRLHILRTPTTLVLDGLGRELVRATGAPKREQVEAALSRL